MPLEFASAPLAPEPSSVEDSLPDLHRVLSMLTSSLRLTLDQVATITGVGRTTLFHWNSGRMTARPVTLRPLLRLHALARSLLAHYGNAEDAAAWLQAGTPSPLEQLIRGDIEAVEDRAAELVFAESTIGHEAYEAFATDLDFDIPAPPSAPARPAFAPV